MSTKFPFILFFLADAMPTPEEQYEADALAPCRVGFRNARMAGAPGALEKCDGVAGKVPEAYAKAYPTAEEAVETYMEKREKHFAERSVAVETAKVKAAEEQAKIADAENKKAAEMAAKAKDHADTKAKEAAEAKKAKAEAAQKAEENAANATEKVKAATAAWKPNA